VILGAVDTALALVENARKDRILSVAKQKDAEQAESLTFRLQPVLEYESAVPVLEGKTRWVPSLSANDEKALTALSSLGSTDYTTWQKKSDLKKATFNRSRTRLINTGLVNQGGDGTYGLMTQAA
jgi:hypothetical protein